MFYVGLIFLVVAILGGLMIICFLVWLLIVDAKEIAIFFGIDKKRQ